MSSPLIKLTNHVPSLNKDTLHPTKENRRATYIDEGLWKVDIDFFKRQTSETAEHLKNSILYNKTFESLDALCASEAEKRHPGTKLSAKKCAKLKLQIAHSACNRRDFYSKPSILSSELKQALGASDEELKNLETQSLFLHNSPLNGQSYRKPDGSICHLSHALTSSNDRTADTVGMARVLADRTNRSICYTGRPDSKHKTTEQVSMMFLHEIKSQYNKGITKEGDVYEFHYVVNCLLDTNPLQQPPFSSALPFFPERKFVEDEVAALDTLKKETITVIDPETKTQYHVRIKPILISQQANFIHRLRNILPPFLTGALRSQEISQKGYEELFAYAKKVMESRGPYGKERLKTILNAMNKPFALDPEKELFLRDLLCKELGLPIVYHCKSSTDRSSIVAVSAALHQWQAMRLPIPRDFVSLLDDCRFKELVAMNLMTAHQVTRYSRAAKGEVNGEKLNKNILGLEYGKGALINSLIPQLLPKRYVKEYEPWKNLKQKVQNLSMPKKIALGGALAVSSPLIAAAGVLGLIILQMLGLISTAAAPFAGKNWRVCFHPLLPITLIKNLKHAFPKYVFNESSPQIKERSLLKAKVKGVD